jgi:hypothetical protein
MFFQKEKATETRAQGKTVMVGVGIQEKPFGFPQNNGIRL